MHYPKNVQYLRYNIRSNYDARTSNTGDKIRYKIVKYVHIGVKLLYDHERTSDRDDTVTPNADCR